MLDQDILRRAPTVLSPKEQRRYFEDGCLVLPQLVPREVVQRLQGAMADLVERSRAVTSSDGAFVLEQGHSAHSPRLHRVTNPQDHHPVFWDFFTSGLMVELAADVVGPDVKFHHAKLNVKSGEGTGSFDWHQDVPGWPHTDFSPVSIGIYLDDCGPDQGPLTLVRGSNHGELFRMHDAAGKFVGIAPEVVEKLDPKQFLEATGAAGTVVLINCRVIHGSVVNRSPRARPLLIPVYSSADSFCYVANPLPTPRCGEIVRGRPAAFASFDTRPCPMPPDWSRKVSSPWVETSVEQA